MSGQRIQKDHTSHTLQSNLVDYLSERQAFNWADARAAIQYPPNEETLNIAASCLDRHVSNGRGDRLALRWIDNQGQAVNVTYDDLMRRSCQFANVLSELGVTKGDRVFCLLNRLPDLYSAALGTWRFGAVFCPLFSAFGPEPIFARMDAGNASVLVTTPLLYRRKVEKIRPRLPKLDAVLLVGDDVAEDAGNGLFDLRSRMAKASDAFEAAATGPEDLSTLHFTSGTTGTPKGAMHVHSAIVNHYASARFALDLHEDDVFWCTADPGWVTGTSYGIIAPLLCGCTMISDSEEFDAERWYRILQDQKVNVWYTAPTAVRMMMKIGMDAVRKYDLSNLRFISSVGEPLNPEAVYWGQEAFGLPIHDNWWQSETGGIMISNFAAVDIKPGSMGLPLPGIDAAIVRHWDHHISFLEEPDEEGELAIKTPWPSIYRGYLNNEEKYKASMVDGWYLTGDLARRDDDGYFWFVGRADDVIKSAGHLIGPFEVESALMEHEAVAEVGVIGIPDEVAMEVVKAFVALKEGFDASDQLNRELMAHARKRLGPAVAPREIEFKKNLPKTRSGKIMRRLLKARELGLPEGDISTLESDTQ